MTEIGEKASIIAKSTKTPVTVYRMFLKFSMVFAVLSLFFAFNGKERRNSLSRRLFKQEYYCNLAEVIKNHLVFLHRK